MAEKPGNTGKRFKGKTTKKCGGCGTENGNASKKCKNCPMEFTGKRPVTEKERIEKLGETSPSYQRDLMMYRTSVLNERHGQHIIVLSFSRHGKGYTTHLHGTAGPGAKFLTETESGKIVEKLYDNFMRRELKVEETRRENVAATTSKTTDDLTQPTTSTHTNNTNNNLNNVITSNDNDNDNNANDLTKPTASTLIINNTNNTNNVNTSNADDDDNNADQGNANNDNDNNFIDNQYNEDIVNNTNHNNDKGHGINAPSNDTNVQVTITTTTATTSEPDSVQEPITKRPRTSTCTQGTSQRVVKIDEGSKLMVLDKDKKAQALCTLFSMKTLHNHVLPKGHVGIAIYYVVPNCTLKPVCPTEFDGDVIEQGGYYIWPIELLASHEKLLNGEFVNIVNN